MSDKWFDISSGLIDEIVIIIDAACRILFINHAASVMLGISNERALGNDLNGYVKLYNEGEGQITFNAIWQSASPEKIYSNELTLSNPDGNDYSILLKAEKIISYKNDFLITVIKDLSYEKNAFDLLMKSEKHYRMLIDNISDLISIISYDGDILYMSPSVELLLGYSIDELIGDNLNKIIDHDNIKKVKERIKSVVSENRHFFSAEHLILHSNGTWLDFESTGSIVYDEEGKISSIVFNSRDITQRKKTEKELDRHRNHLEELVKERTIELEEMNTKLYEEIEMRKISDEERKKNVIKLRKTLTSAVEAIALTVETRDPYTAGHQRRVSQLSEAIAREMGLTDEIIESIHMAGILHDLGKIYVPSEILTRPGPLIDEEFSLIMIHAKVGYDILKTIEFPWPLDQIVYQHHERIDGSGYPQGLCGDEIRLESKILAVADTVEAMSTHRPYRPAVGLENALNEITDKKGTSYDESVVGACKVLFKNKGFTFE